ncbi:hypothetical protein [Sphingobacterium sp. UME9]|uniref:hypothetical protein n=1 Tax=Sphingobacterium sp. UME9 TaxID=1862316 RepID=UPI0015FF0546|nr:hypothetical protein [Sphingobacterium sp. UME9]MBB1643636.1 hypothetical protein [Sphingobacterium sp. UME9]
MTLQKLLSFWLIPTIIILTALLMPFFGLALYDYWKKFIGDSSGYNSINAVVGVCVGILHILTLIFLYINFIQQRNQIEDQKEELRDNKRDLEFNRSIEVIYKQLEYCRPRFEESRFRDIIVGIGQDRINFRQFFNDISAPLRNRDRSFNFEPTFFTNNFVESVDILLNFLQSELSVFDKQISKTVFSDETELELVEIVTRNIDENLVDGLTNLQAVYRDFKSSEHFDLLFNQFSSRFNNIEFNLLLVLSYLKIPVMVDLTGEDNE